MEIVFTDKVSKDIRYWKSKKNKPFEESIEKLLESMLQTPFKGIGKPDHLYDLYRKT